MLNVRLQRTGKRGQAYFRVVVLEHTKKPKGKYLELLGNYNPHQKKLEVNRERVEYWVAKGAQVTPTVNNLLVNYKIWDRPKMQSWKAKKKPSDAKAMEGTEAPTAPVQAKTEPTPETPAAEPEQKTKSPEPTASAEQPSA